MGHFNGFKFKVFPDFLIHGKSMANRAKTLKSVIFLA